MHDQFCNNCCPPDWEKNRFKPENRFIGDIEDGKRYPFDVYTKAESDERFAAKITESALSELAIIVNGKAAQADLDSLSSAVATKADESECIDIRSRLDALEVLPGELAQTNLLVASKANTSDVNTAVNDLQEQINQIEISASAEAVVAPEVAAARVGADGTSYETLKERIDTEVTTLSEGIADTKNSLEILDYNEKSRFVTGKNIFNKDTALSGTHLTINGTTEPVIGYYTSDYMLVEPETDYWVNRAGDYTLMCFYDKDKTFISYDMHNASTAFTSPQNAVYARLGISVIDNVQVEKGTGVTAYEPYRESLKYDRSYSELNKKIDDVSALIVTGKNLYNKDNSEIGKHLNADGSTDDVSGYLTSEYIEVEESTEYWLNKAGNYTLVCWYNDKKECIGNEMHNASTAFTSLQGTKYARLGLTTVAVDVQFEKGTAVTSYEKYYNTFKYEKPVADDSDIYADAITTGKNLYNKDKSEIGKHLNTDGTTNDVSGYLTSEYIPIEPEADYWLNRAGNYTLVCWYDQYKNCVGYDMHNASTAFTSLPDAKYARLGLNTSAQDVQFEKGTAVTEYEKYYNTFKYEKPKDSGEGSVTYVLDASGEGDFTGWVEATTAIEDVPNVILHVKAGVYDIAEELGDEWLAAYDVNVNGWGPKLGNNVHVIMEPNAILKFENVNNYSNVLTYFSPINTGYGGYTLEGGRIVCKNCRYAIHEDEYSRERFGKIIIKGVYMYIDNTTDNPSAGTRCIGGGTGKCSNVTIEECVFDTPVTSRNTPLVSYHTSAADNARSQVVIKNNYFKAQGFLRLTWYGASTLMSRFTVTGNNFGSAMPALAPEDAEHYPTNNIELLEWSNVVR